MISCLSDFCYNEAMSVKVLYGYEHETLEAKAAWFRTLSVADRLRHLDAMYRLAVAVNPNFRKGRELGQILGSVRVLELPEVRV